jgi:hypothetical protein
MDTRRIARGMAAILAAATIAAALPLSVASAPGAGSVRGVGDRSPERAAAAPCVRGSSACPIRIAFRHGKYTGQARSSLTSQGQERWFVVRAKAGQTMVVVVNGKGPTGGTVYFPGGGQDGGPGGRVFDGSLPTSGDYRIRVTESLMAEPWSGWVDVVVLIY